MNNDDASRRRAIPQRRQPTEFDWDEADAIDTRRGDAEELASLVNPGAAPPRRPTRSGQPANPLPPSSRSARPAQRVPAGAGQAPPSAPPQRPPGTRVMPAAAAPPDRRRAPTRQPPSTRPSPSAPAAAKRRRRVRPLRILVLLLVAYLAFEVYTPVHAWNSVTRVDDTPEGERPAAGDGYNYLLVGSDGRDDLSKAERKRLGTGSAGGQRTDSIILIHVPGSGGKSSMISLPRDSYVPIPGHGSNKINAAFAFGGAPLLIATVEQVTGLRIDGYLEIGFGGFADLVDSMGGVTICAPFAMKDKDAHINIPKGCQVMDGKTSLGYVRARHSDPRGDIGRADRQRQFLAALMKQIATPSTVLVPWTWWNSSHAAVAGLAVGEDTSMMDAYRVVTAMRGLSSKDTLSYTVPIASLGYATSAGSAVKWDTKKANDLFSQLRDGTALEKPPAGTDGDPSGG